MVRILSDVDTNPCRINWSYALHEHPKKNFCKVELVKFIIYYISFSGVTTQPIIDRSQMELNCDTIMPTSLDTFNVFI